MKIDTFDFNSCFIIAEMSANHNGDINIAKETIRAAKRAGANAIKLQTYTADTITLDVKSDYFKVSHGTAWDGRYLHDLYQEAYTPWEWHEELFTLAKKENIICFSSPFDRSAVDLLFDLKAPAYKIASFEITDIPLIKYVASKGKPIIISTGVAGLEDIELAIKACQDEGNEEIAILKCTSSYPASPEEANLITIPDIKKRFNVIPGLSDHTMGIEAAIVAVSLGAKIIEKHFILNKEIGGVDSHFSLDESEFTQMVKSVRIAEKMLGIVDYELTEKKKKNREFARSLFIAEDVVSGEKVTDKNVRSVRPGHGLAPKNWEKIKNTSFNRELKKGTPLQEKYLNL